MRTIRSVAPAIMVALLASGATAIPAHAAPQAQVSNTKTTALTSISRDTPAAITATGSITYRWKAAAGSSIASVDFSVVASNGNSTATTKQVVSTVEGTSTVTVNRTNLKPGAFTVKEILVTDTAGTQRMITDRATLDPLTVQVSNAAYDGDPPVVKATWAKTSFLPGEDMRLNWTMTDANVHTNDRYAPVFHVAGGTWLRTVVTSRDVAQGTMTGYSYRVSDAKTEVSSAPQVIDIMQVQDLFTKTVISAPGFAQVTYEDPKHVAPIPKLTGSDMPGQSRTLDLKGYSPGASFGITWNAGPNTAYKTITGSTLKMPTTGYKGSAVYRATVTATWPDGAVRVRTVNSLTPAVSFKPVLPGKVSVSGTSETGGNLTGTFSGWPQGYALDPQWLKEDGSQATYKGQVRYSPVPADAGKSVKFCVTGTKTGHPDLGACAATQVKAPAYPAYTVSTPISDGTRTSLVPGGSIRAFPETRYLDGQKTTYQWFRNNAPIQGATGQAYWATPADQGTTIKGSVTVTAPGYTPRTSWSASHKVVAASYGAETVVLGSRRVGAELQAFQGYWSPGLKVTHQWLRNNTPIKGATSDIYKQVAADLNKTITVRTTGAQAGYETKVLTSYSRGKTTIGMLPNTTSTIAGDPRVGARQTATHTHLGGAKYSYQWLRDGKAIKGATKNTYVPAAGDLGRKLGVSVTLSAPGYSNRTHTVSIAKLAPAKLPTHSVGLYGIKKVGKTVQAAGKSKASGVTYSYQWLRGGKNIAKATKSTYKLTKADRYRYISVRVTAKKHAHANLDVRSKSYYVK